MTNGDDNLENLKAEAKNEPDSGGKNLKYAKRTIPLVEGINAPRSTSDVILVKSKSGGSQAGRGPQTQEQKEEPKLLPQSLITRVNRKKHRVKGPLVTGLFLLVLIAAAYEGYIWYTGKQILPIPGYSYHFNQPLVTSTPDSLMNLTNASNSTSSLINLSGSATTTPTSTPASLPKLKINNTSTGFLNVRNAASSNGKIVTQVHPGETYIYINSQNGWFDITLKDGSSGWVSGQYVTVVSK